MSISFIDEAPQIIKDYLFYMQTVKGKSQKTVDEYYIDLRTFFRFIKLQRGLVPNDSEFENISISDVDLELVKTVTLNDAYEFMNYIQRERKIKMLPVPVNVRALRVILTISQQKMRA